MVPPWSLDSKGEVDTDNPHIGFFLRFQILTIPLCLENWLSVSAIVPGILRMEEICNVCIYNCLVL